MKVFLDDIRNPPDDSWTVVRTARDCFSLLENEQVEVISLDHDLGENVQTGYDVANWIERKVFLHPSYKCPDILIHSANPVGRQNIQRVIESIERWRWHN